MKSFLRFVKSRFRGSGWTRFVDTVDGLLKSGGHDVNIFDRLYEDLQGVERGIRSDELQFAWKTTFRGCVFGVVVADAVHSLGRDLVRPLKIRRARIISDVHCSTS